MAAEPRNDRHVSIIARYIEICIDMSPGLISLLAGYYQIKENPCWIVLDDRHDRCADGCQATESDRDAPPSEMYYVYYGEDDKSQAECYEDRCNKD
mgnify:FL=1